MPHSPSVVVTVETAWVAIRTRHPEVPAAVVVLASGTEGGKPRGIADTSRQGRYHNRRYRAVATELGLAVGESAPWGWTATELAEATAADYAQELAALAVALTVV